MHGCRIIKHCRERVLSTQPNAGRANPVCIDIEYSKQNRLNIINFMRNYKFVTTTDKSACSGLNKNSVSIRPSLIMFDIYARSSLASTSNAWHVAAIASLPLFTIVGKSAWCGAVALDAKSTKATKVVCNRRQNRILATHKHSHGMAWWW